MSSTEFTANATPDFGGSVEGLGSSQDDGSGLLKQAGEETPV